MILTSLLSAINAYCGLTFKEIREAKTDEAIICKQICLEYLLDHGISNEGCIELLGCVIFPIDLTSQYIELKNKIAPLITSEATLKNYEKER